ncbi:uncharacterized protein LOC143367924 [Andrena cerasifolii]|uniref:uncharacterized protein LOC143367924 n=1 Tax=Andrena cerasifolii TaxID=2819439 RepID=UPI0040380786
MDMKISQLQIERNSFLSVTINVDGLPVRSSTTNSFWPILCVLDQSVNKEPFIVELYYIASKPNDANSYLRPFVDECIDLENNGIIINDKKYAFRLSCITADTPARAFLKCIKSHNSLHACEKCTQEGTFLDRTTCVFRPHPGRDNPTKFSRGPRHIHLCKHWKATEFRSFILYLGPVVLANILTQNLYEHFLVLHCAIYVLCGDFSVNSEWCQYADNLLQCFVKNIPIFYAKELLVYNFHNLLHLTADASNFGKLDNFSAFPFENFMTKIKRMVRSHNHPLEQIVKRLGALKSIHKLSPRLRIVKKKNKIFKVILDDIYIININSCFNTKCGDIVVIKAIEKITGSSFYKLKCEYSLYRTDYYKEPIESSRIGIWKVSRKKEKYICSSDLNKKWLLLPNFKENNNDESFISIPFASMTLCNYNYKLL